MYKIQYMIGNDVETIKIDISLMRLSSFIDSIRQKGGRILSVHRQKWDDITATINTEHHCSLDQDWISGECLHV